MTFEADLPLFRYSPLPHASHSLRLLEILRVDEHSASTIQVHCRLTTFPCRSKAKPYTALSYTWGDPTKTTLILVNGQAMRVRRNCEDVLKQAHWQSRRRQDDDGHGQGQGGGGKKRSFFWCDAICIDQSNEKEKSHQVAAMGAIFSRARRVLACVGGSSDDELLSCCLWEEVAVLFGAVRANRSFLSLLSCSLKGLDPKTLRYRGGSHSSSRSSSGSAFSKRQDLHWAIAKWLWWQRRRKRRDIAALFRALEVVLQQEYFTRLWVYPELFLGHDVRLCFRGESVPLRLLYPLLVIVLAAHKENRWADCLTITDECAGTIRRVAPLVAAGSYRAHEQDKMTLRALLRDGVSLKCEDARDKIYGVLSMVQQQRRRGIIGSKKGETDDEEEEEEVVGIFPDYSRDVFDLAVQAFDVMKTEATGSRTIRQKHGGVEEEIREFFGTLEPLVRMVTMSWFLSEGMERAVQIRRAQFSSRRTYQLLPPAYQERRTTKGAADDGGSVLGRLHCVGARLTQVDGSRTLHLDDERLDATFSTILQYPDIAMSGNAKCLPITRLLLPPNAEVGDWVLFPATTLPAGRSLVLIARPPLQQQHPEYEQPAQQNWPIIGKGLAWSHDLDAWRAMAQGQVVASVCFAHEDLVALFCSWDFGLDVSRMADVQISYFLTTSVCGLEGSSFAVRAEAKQEDEDEEEKRVGPRLRMSRLSSSVMR